LRLCELLSAEPSLGGPIFLSSERIHDCKFVFTSKNAVYGVVACDEVIVGTKWLKGGCCERR